MAILVSIGLWSPFRNFYINLRKYYDNKGICLLVTEV